MPKKSVGQGKPGRKKEETWLNEDVETHTGLPPQVYGQVRCFCKLTVSQVVWAVPKPPDLALVRVKWWGEEGDGILFRPLDVTKSSRVGCQTTARYPVRSGPCQFATYLNDMGSLMLDLLTDSNSEVVGQATIGQIGQLTNTRPINGFFPVMSTNGQKLANLQVSLVLEPLLASYDNLGSIPTTDIGMENGRMLDSMVMPVKNQPLPYSDVPQRPDSNIFISPTSVNEGQKGQAKQGQAHPDSDLRQQLDFGLPVVGSGLMQGHHSSSGTVAITTNGDVVSLPESRAISSKVEHMGLRPIDIHGGNKGFKSPVQTTGSTDKDLLSVLVEKGTKLREAMIVSSMNTNHSSNLTTADSEMTNDFKFAPSVSPGEAGEMVSELVGLYGSAVDAFPMSPVTNQDFQLYSLLNGISPGSSVSSDMGYGHGISDPEDPLHENSVLQDLYYHNSDNEGLVSNDFIGYGQSPSMHRKRSPAHRDMSLPPRLLGGGAGYYGALDAAGNQRPPSRTSSLTSLNKIEPVDSDLDVKKVKRTKRRRRSSSRSSSHSQTRSNTPRRSESRPKASSVKDVAGEVSKDKAVKSKKKSRSRSNSRSRSRSRSRKRKTSLDGGSDSDRLSSAVSENSKARHKQKSDGLSVERLTLLGRVHVARVNIDSLQLSHSDLPDFLDGKHPGGNKFRTGRPPRSQKSKKLRTYFVEFQFPVTAPSRSKQTANATATELTRIVSKNIQDRTVAFSHRSVFSVLFDGAAVERWWKSALVFRLYCREAGQQAPVLIGSGGLSLKSVLRSENLCLQKRVDIFDTRGSGLHNNSQASLNSSGSGRSGASVFGILKVSVELASDHKEFPTILARTKLAEMSGDVKVVPIGGSSSEQAKAVGQQNLNKHQPGIKSPTKQIDIPGLVTQSAITGLPPQSPRRKTTEPTTATPEDGREISKLKQQLKATLAALSDPSLQKTCGAHMDAGANVFGGQRNFEPTTLHTLLSIPEGRNISVNGVPPLHMVTRYPGMMQAKPETAGLDSMMRNTYLVCRMFWTNDAIHSDVCWGTLNPEYNFLQVAPVLMTAELLERMRDNFMIVEVWDKKVSSGNDKLIGMVKLSLHQFYLSFRERRIANALLKSEYPVLAIDNYVPIVNPFSGLHFGQLKVVLAMGSKSQIANLQQLALGSDAADRIPLQPLYLERQDLLKDGEPISRNMVEHQFEIVVEGLRGLHLFENMIWGEADCFVQFFFPTEGDHQGEEDASFKSIPTMKCFRTGATLCIPDPTFHDISRHKLWLPAGVPIQRELLTACANSGESVTGLPFEVWCRYYHPNVRDQLIAKSKLPLSKLCAMITMSKSREVSTQSFSLRLSQAANEGGKDDGQLTAKSHDAGLLDVSVSYKCQPAVSDSVLTEVNRRGGSHVCLTVGVIRASGLKAAADGIAQLDSSMTYPASVGVNVYVRVKVSCLGKENERTTKTMARTFAPEFAHWIDFSCPLLCTQTPTSPATSLAEQLESAEVLFEVWHQTPAGLPSKDFYAEKRHTGIAVRKLAHQTGDVLLGTAVVPLVSLLTRRMGINGWFPISLPTLGWSRPVADAGVQDNTALDQVVGGLELSVKFAHQDDRDRVVSTGRSLGWSPLDADLEQMEWQDEDSHVGVHSITVSVEQASFPLSSALPTGQLELDPQARCYVRYKFYDKGAVVSKSKKLDTSESSLFCCLEHKHNFMLSHTAPLQWYLCEERLEVQVWVTYGRREGEKKPGRRDRLIGSCYLDLESLTNMRRRQQRVSGLYPLFKPGVNHLRAAFVKAHVVSRVSSSPRDQASETEKAASDSEVSVSGSQTDQSSSDVQYQSPRNLSISQSPRKQKHGRAHPQASFAVVLAVERAMHLPKVTERNRSGQVNPTTYVSFQSVERAKPTYSSVFPNSVNPVWDYVVETRLSTDYLYKENKNLVLKVWHKPSEAPKAPDKSCDRVLGFVSVDLTSLTKGFQQICGWYNIMDFNGQCKGQIKVSITPLDLQTVLPAGSALSSNLLLPSLVSHARTSMDTAAVASSIAQQLSALQQHVLRRMAAVDSQSGALSPAAAGGAHSRHGAAVSDVPAANSEPELINNLAIPSWTPQLVLDNRTDEPSKSYLFSSLRRQLQDLDSMTQKLKDRLSASPKNEDANQKQTSSSHSGEILTGTHSDLSTIHTTSVFMNTRDSFEPNPSGFSFEVGTSQESARSGTINNSSVLENETYSVRTNKDTSSYQGHGLVDSGVFSTKNDSEKSTRVVGPSPSAERNTNALDSINGLTNLPSTGRIQHSVVPVGTFEAKFAALAVEDLQTLQSTFENSESCANSHGFVPRTQKSTMTESYNREMGDTRGNSNDKNSNSSRGTEGGCKQVDHNSGSGSARSQEKTEEKVEVEGNAISEEVEEEDEEEEKEEEEEEEPVGYGNFHKYREMLDEKEWDRDEGDGDDDVDVVEVVPRSLNNISTVLTLDDAVRFNLIKITGESVKKAMENENSPHLVPEVAHPEGSPASPNVNALEGTSVWCSEDNDDSFFQQVFESNTRLLVQNGENVDEVALNTWLQEQSAHDGKTRLESWLEVHRLDADWQRVADTAKEELPRGITDGGDNSYVKDSGSINNKLDDEAFRWGADLQATENSKLGARSNGQPNGEDRGEKDDRIFSQSSEKSSNEPTPRHFWIQEPNFDEHFANPATENSAELKDFVKSTDKFDEDQPAQSNNSSNNSKKYRSNTEFHNLTSILPQNEHAQTDMKSGHAQDDIIQPSGGRTPTVASNQTINDECMTESGKTHADDHYVSQGARPKTSNLLSNGDLESNYAPRPHTEIRHKSKTSTDSQNSYQSMISRKSTTTSFCSGKNPEAVTISEKSGQDMSVESVCSNPASSPRQQTTTNGQVTDAVPNHNRNNFNVGSLKGNKTSVEMKTSNIDKDLTQDLTFADGDRGEIPNFHPNSLVNGMCSSYEDSGIDKNEVGRIYTSEKSGSMMPNFFMSEKDMEASMTALRMATAAAKHEEKVRSENKVKAVSELVSKITSSKTRSSSLSIKNKQLPSAEEAKRIAKIFSSKIS